jgi:hypothetical protein
MTGWVDAGEDGARVLLRSSSTTKPRVAQRTLGNGGIHHNLTPKELHNA